MNDLVMWATGNFVDEYMTSLLDLLGRDFRQHPLFKNVVEKAFEDDPEADQAVVFHNLKMRCYGLEVV